MKGKTATRHLNRPRASLCMNSVHAEGCSTSPYVCVPCVGHSQPTRNTRVLLRRATLYALQCALYAPKFELATRPVRVRRLKLKPNSKMCILKLVENCFRQYSAARPAVSEDCLGRVALEDCLRQAVLEYCLRNACFNGRILMDSSGFIHAPLAFEISGVLLTYWLYESIDSEVAYLFLSFMSREMHHPRHPSTVDIPSPI